jgi:cytochrome b involved in lipid metabolism
MKKDVIIEFLLGFIGVLWILILIIQRPMTTIQKPSVNTNGIPKNQSISSIQSHNTEKDCWIIISKSIYDVTTYISQHPGGNGAITAYCGGDATEAFQTKNGQGPHSQKAERILQQYLVGTLQ